MASVLLLNPMNCFRLANLPSGSVPTFTVRTKLILLFPRKCLEYALGAVHRSVLNCPQGTQRGLLRLRQALDPYDIQPLIGSVASQCAQMLATLQVPDGDGSILPATGQPASIGTQLERLHRPLMGLSHPHAFSTLHVPPAQSPVTASTDHQFPTRGPAQRRDHPRMPYKGPHARPAVRIPHEQLSAVCLPLAARARSQARAIGAEGHAHDDPMMPRQPQELRATPGVPHIDVAIFAPADQPRPIGTPGHPTEKGWVRTTRQSVGAGCHLPYQHALQHGAAGQKLSIGTPGH